MRNTMISPDIYRDDSPLASWGGDGHSGWALNDKASESNAMTESHADNLWSERFHIIAAEHLASVSNVTFHPPLSHLTV